MAVKRYQDLMVWQRAMDLAESTYRMTNAMPPEERFGLTSQLRAAAVSVPSNLAEGHERGSTAEFIRYIGIAKGSLAEAETQVMLAVRLGFIESERADQWLHDAAEVGRLSNGLATALRTRRR